MKDLTTLHFQQPRMKSAEKSLVLKMVQFPTSQSLHRQVLANATLRLTEG